MNFKTIQVEMPHHDCDVLLTFPSGKTVIIQVRPSNADINYNGSLDIILPNDQLVTNWQGDMSPAPAARQDHTRKAKQLVTELP